MWEVNNQFISTEFTPNQPIDAEPALRSPAFRAITLGLPLISSIQYRSNRVSRIEARSQVGTIGFDTGVSRRTPFRNRQRMRPRRTAVNPNITCRDSCHINLQFGKSKQPAQKTLAKTSKCPPKSSEKN